MKSPKYKHFAIKLSTGFDTHVAYSVAQFAVLLADSRHPFLRASVSSSVVLGYVWAMKTRDREFACMEEWSDAIDQHMNEAIQWSRKDGSLDEEAYLLMHNVSEENYGEAGEWG